MDDSGCRPRHRPPGQQGPAGHCRRPAGHPDRRPAVGGQLREDETPSSGASRSSSGTSSSGSSSARRCTYTAYRLVLRRARPHRPMAEPDDDGGRPMSTLAAAAADTGVNGVALTVLIVLFARRHRAWASWPRRWRRADSMESLDEWGLGGRTLRHLGHLVPARRRPLHGLHLRRGARRRCSRSGAVSGLLRRALHDRALPDHLHLHVAAVVGQPPARLRHHRPTSSRAATARAGCPWPSRSPASSRRCPTSPSSWSASRPCSRSSGSAAAATGSPRTCRCSSRSRVLAAYTYSSGLRAPALIAFVKDTLIYLVIIVAVIYLPDQGRRLGRTSSTRPRTKMADDQPGDRQADRRVHPRRRRSTGPTPRSALGLGAGAVHVPALDHGDAVVQEPQHDPPQRRDPAGVLLRARPAGPARLGRDRGRHQADRPRRQAQRAAGHPPAVRGHRSRRWFAGVAFAAIAIGALVPAAIMSIAAANTVHPQHLQGVAQARRDAAQEAKVSKLVSLRGEGVRAGLRADAGQAERDQLPAARRHLDPADASRRSCSASTPAGSTAGRCSPAGRSAWSTARSTAYNVVNPATGEPLRRLAGDDPGASARWATSR